MTYRCVLVLHVGSITKDMLGPTTMEMEWKGDLLREGTPFYFGFSAKAIRREVEEVYGSVKRYTVRIAKDSHEQRIHLDLPSEVNNAFYYFDEDNAENVRKREVFLSQLRAVGWEFPSAISERAALRDFMVL